MSESMKKKPDRLRLLLDFTSYLTNSPEELYFTIVLPSVEK